LYAARSLKSAPVRVTLVDKQNHHLFQPLLYQVATCGLSSPDIASPLRKILREQKNITVLLDEAQQIDADNQTIKLQHTDLSYDFLIVATGAGHTYFGNDDWAEHAPGLKTLRDALQIRKRILLAYENAERLDDPKDRKPWLTFVVVGGGPTGVELAGALSEIARHTMAKNFRRCDPADARVVLIDAADRILPSFSEELSHKAQKQLQALGVEVRVQATVTAIDDKGVELAGDRIDARTVLWAAGVAGSPIAKSLGVPLDRAGRVVVDSDLSVPGHSEVFVVGDLAAVKQGESWVPGVAPAAIQQGRHAAANIERKLLQKSTEPFRYQDKGSLATIGRSRAVAQLGRFGFGGFFAWVAWLVVHIFFLIGYRNRFTVLFEWAWAYITYQRSARIILTDD